jgi:hypothetical protein
MKKTILISSILSSLLFSSLSASDTEVDLLKSEIENLKLELSLMKDRIDSNEAVNDEVLNSLADTNDNLIDIDERVDDVESVALSDKIKFSFAFRSEIDSFSTEYTDGVTYDTGIIGNTRLRLNMESEVTDNMKFFGRLSMDKHWGTPFVQIPLYDYSEGRRPGTSTLYVERAYVKMNYLKSTNTPIDIIIGRLPSTDGPSLPFKDNTVRKSMNSALIFDGAVDGAQITINTDKVVGLYNSNLRFAYGKFMQNDIVLSDAYTTFSDSNFYGLFYGFDLSKDTKSHFEASLVKGDHIPNQLGEDTGTLDFAYVYLEFPNLYKTGLSLFGHLAFSRTDPSGNNVNGPGLLGAEYGDTDSKDGYAFWLGSRYKFDLPSMKNPRIGFEYNYGSQNFINMIQGSSDLVPKLAIRGSAYEIYYTQPLNNYAFVRLSGIYYEAKFAGNAMETFTKTGDLGSNGVQAKNSTRITATFNIAF